MLEQNDTGVKDQKTKVAQRETGKCLRGFKAKMETGKCRGCQYHIHVSCGRGLRGEGGVGGS